MLSKQLRPAGAATSSAVGSLPGARHVKHRARGVTAHGMWASMAQLCI